MSVTAMGRSQLGHTTDTLSHTWMHCAAHNRFVHSLLSKLHTLLCGDKFPCKICTQVPSTLSMHCRFSLYMFRTEPTLSMHCRISLYMFRTDTMEHTTSLTALAMFDSWPTFESSSSCGVMLVCPLQQQLSSMLLPYVWPNLVMLYSFHCKGWEAGLTFVLNLFSFGFPGIKGRGFTQLLGPYTAIQDRIRPFGAV